MKNPEVRFTMIFKVFYLALSLSLGSYNKPMILYTTIGNIPLQKQKNCRAFLRSAAVLFCGLNLSAVLEFHFYVVPAVHRHVVHQSAPKPAVEFGNRRVHPPDGFTKFLI